ncbi:MAG: nicotinate-nucleotide--dimethylbenzimidazole phosphoribosyltransferase [Pseudomonadota bacterium]
MTPWWQAPCKTPDGEARTAALARQAQLTKPPGSLGRLEALAVELAALGGRGPERPWITVFAGDHGVVAEGVAAYPQAVTRLMLANFVAGGAAVSVLARQIGARLEVVDAGTLAGAALPGVIADRAGDGTANLARQAAMTSFQLENALAAGRRAAERALTYGAGLFIGGEMGIGNSTVAAALGCALLGLPGEALAGPGTGLNAAGVEKKAGVIDGALALHGLSAEQGRQLVPSPSAHALFVLQHVGGFELAGLAGAYVACAQAGVPVLVDGFISTASALAACRLNPGARPWLLFAHRSAEPGHRRLLEALAAQPLLDLDLRLGEGSGAAAAYPLLAMAWALHRDMATFAAAGIDA